MAKNDSYVVLRRIGITTTALADDGTGYEFDEQSEDTMIFESEEDAQEALEAYRGNHPPDEEPEHAEITVEPLGY